MITLTEEELDTLVSIAIRRAELLDEIASPAANVAWAEVMAYEERISAITPAEDIPGGVARVGAVRAALAAGLRQDAARLASVYLGSESLPSERRLAIERAFQEDHELIARHFPILAKTGRLSELEAWRNKAAGTPRVFPWAA